MARLRDHDAIYLAAEVWKRECLLKDGSIFGAGAVWSLGHADELVRDFVDRPDEGDRTFEQKLRDQLATSSRAAKQLAAEMLWVMMLFPSNLKQERKLALVKTVWDWSDTPLADPDRRLDVFEFGIGSGGMGYNNYRPFELFLLVRFTKAWKELESAEWSRLLENPWQFVDWFDRLPGATSRQIRHMLLHLLFPDHFERISSRNDKKAVDKAFTPLLAKAGLTPNEQGPSAEARDRRLLRIRQELEKSMPDVTVDFYDVKEIRERWKEEAPDEGPKPVREPMPRPYGTRPRKSWAIGAAAGAARWPNFLETETIAIGWDELGDLRAFGSHDEIREAIRETYERDQNPINDSLACFQFCREMEVGDEVYVKQGLNRILGHGRIIGDYEYDVARPDFRNVRRVEWLQKGNWTLPDTAQLPSKTLTDVTHYPAFHASIRGQLGEEGGVDVAAPPYSVDDVVRDAFLAREGVEQILSSLRRRKNLILQGSPGVGKSFLARRLAYALVGAEAPENVQMVQFHQSYAYEDFIQGWRPNSTGGFVLRNGVFHEFCRRAQAHPLEPHVFVIDEINRGNLSKVFGELLLLIEADKRGPSFAIPLTYAESGTDTFFVPENVYIIGLMNTADRSLAMVDYALRRRFAFTTLAPAFESDRFRSTLLERGVDDAVVSNIIARVGEINRRIVSDHKDLGAGFAIGHSYFCPLVHVTDSAAWYDTVVSEEIVPLLREYWFDNEAKVEECSKILAG